MSAIFKTILYRPLYNALVFLVAVIPGGDVGLAIIILTLVVKFLLLPLSHKALRTQRAMKTLEGELKNIKEKYTNKEEQAKKMMELYKTHGVNPFSSFGLILIQLPILIALYYVFYRGLPFHPDILYSFVHVPEQTNFLFLGFIDLVKRSIPLALITGASQFFQISLSVPPTPPAAKGEKSSFSDTLSRSMGVQMRYGMPAMITLISFGLPAAIVLYWLTSNIFMIAQELIVRRKVKAASVSSSKPPLP